MEKRKVTLWAVALMLCLTSVFASQVTLDNQGILRYSNGTLYDGSVSYAKYYLANGTEVFYLEDSGSITVNSGVWNKIVGRSTLLTPEDWFNYMTSSTNITAITEIDGENATEVIVSYSPYSMVSIYSNNSAYLDGQLPSFYLDDTDTNETVRMDSLGNFSIAQIEAALGNATAVNTSSNIIDLGFVTGTVIGNWLAALPNITLAQVQTRVDANGNWSADRSEYMTNVVNDTTPSLGGDLNLTVYNITSSYGYVIRQNSTHVVIGG